MSSPLAGRDVLVAIDAGPGAHRGAEVIRALVRAGAEVHVAATPAAEAWLPALTLETVCGKAVARTVPETLAWRDTLAAGVFVSVGADLLTRLSDARADDAASDLFLRLAPRVVLLPAEDLPAHPWVDARLEAIAESAMVLPGMASIEETAAAVARVAGPRDLEGRRVLVTAGPTRERLDPVRFLSNPSSGRMGHAVAEAAARRGASVVLVTGARELGASGHVEVRRIESARDLEAAVRAEEAEADLVVAAAAVADWTVAEPAAEKVKKQGERRTLELVRTPDVLAGLATRAREAGRRPVLVGFAAETENLEANAREKLLRKGLDLVVANSVKGEDGAFAAKTAEVLLVSEGGAEPLGRLPKREIAERILDRAVALLSRRDAVTTGGTG